MNYLFLILSEIIIISFIIVVKLVLDHKESAKIDKIINTIVDKIDTDEKTKNKFKQSLIALKAGK